MFQDIIFENDQSSAKDKDEKTINGFYEEIVVIGVED